MAHQYIARETGAIVCEKLIADRTIALLYNRLREHAPSLFQALTSKRMSGWLGFLHFDLNLPLCHDRGLALLKRMGVDWRECLAPHHSFTPPVRSSNGEFGIGTVAPWIPIPGPLPPPPMPRS